MKKKKKRDVSPINRDVIKWIKKDPEFAEAYFEELSERPISVQIAILRHLRGLTQEKIAKKLHVKQAYVSKLEKEGLDHLISNYEKLAKLLHGRLVIIPEGAKIVYQPERVQKTRHAA